CLGDVFALVAEFFEQFFTRAQSGKFDSNILIGHSAGELNQLASEIQNFDWFAYIEEEDFSALALSRTLENQSDGFRDGHEVTGDLRVSDFDRSASCNLLVE